MPIRPFARAGFSLRGGADGPRPRGSYVPMPSSDIDIGITALPAPTGGIFTQLDRGQTKAFWRNQVFWWVLLVIIVLSALACFFHIGINDQEWTRTGILVLDLIIFGLAFLTFVYYNGNAATITQYLAPGKGIQDTVCGGTAAMKTVGASSSATVNAFVGL